MHAVPIGQAGAAENAAGQSMTQAYTLAVLGWLLSAGVYIAAKWVAPEMPPWALCFWRLTLACVILLPIVHRHHGAMLGLLKERTLELAVIGAVGLALCQGMIFVGLHYTDATTAGIIMALCPIMTIVLARFILGEALGLQKALGAIFALAGMLWIVSRGDLGALLRLQFSVGELWIVGSAFCFGLYTVLLRRSKFDMPMLPLLVLLLGVGALAALPFYLWELASGDRSALDRNGLLALAYIAGPGGALMYFLYNRSVGALGAGRASMLMYLQTVFVAILAWLLLGEGLHGYDLAGAAFIVAGILLVTLARRV
ncbi:MAG: EamA family transporter [Mesorhizobium sp.]|nr:EamA family transporter [Mesorhizobium sp.]